MRYAKNINLFGENSNNFPPYSAKPASIVQRKPQKSVLAYLAKNLSMYSANTPNIFQHIQEKQQKFFSIFSEKRYKFSSVLSKRGKFFLANLEKTLQRFWRRWQN